MRQNTGTVMILIRGMIEGQIAHRDVPAGHEEG
jgi:hypothetical protein